MTTNQPSNTPFDDILAEVFRRTDRGEHPACEEYATRYPDHAKELREFFDDLRFVDDHLDKHRQSAQALGLGSQGTAGAPTAKGDAVTDDAFALPRFGRFQLLDELDGGGQGIVYRAKQFGTKRIVALKVIREGALASASERQRFKNEVTLASRLDHPNIVSVYECGQEDGRDYFAMEYVDGEPLDRYLCTRTLSIEETLTLFLQICDAVHYAHQRGVIHRDLKPSNVLVDEFGCARILDFGLAKPVSPAESAITMIVTQTGSFAGTWYYASPEQAMRDSSLIDIRSDVYSLGVILYEMLTDFLPYPVSGKSCETVAQSIIETPPIRPSSIRSDIEDDLQTIILIALHKDRERRYQSAAAFREDLRRFLNGEAIAAKRDNALYVARKALYRYRWPVAAVATALALLTAFAVTVTVLYLQATQAKTTMQVRSDVVRRSQRYLMTKLGELSFRSGVVTELDALDLDLPQLELLLKPVADAPMELLEAVYESMPGQLLDSLRGTDADARAAAEAWLHAWGSQLDQIRELRSKTRFEFREQAIEATALAWHEHQPRRDVPIRLCEAFATRALYRYRTGDDAEATADLEAARSITLDQGYSPLYMRRVDASISRSSIYDAVLAILSESVHSSRSVAPYVEWVLRDGPMPAYRGGLVTERHTLAQFCEGASVADSSDGRGRIDIELLNAMTEGLFEKNGEIPQRVRQHAEATTPEAMLAMIDAVIAEVATWDDLTGREIEQNWKQFRAGVREDPAWTLVRISMNGYPGGYHFRARVGTKRAAAILAAYLCEYRRGHGTWPRSFNEAVPINRHDLLVVPYFGTSFRYRLTDGLPQIHAMDVYDMDYLSRPMKRMEEGKDELLFPYPPPPIP